MTMNMPPTKFSFGFSGFPPPGPGAFRWKDGQLMYRQPDRIINGPHWNRAVVPTPEQWQELWRMCDEVDVWSWPSFVGRMHVIDGLGYDLEIEVGGRAMKSSGQLAPVPKGYGGGAPEGFRDKVLRLLAPLHAMAGYQTPSVP